MHTQTHTTYLPDFFELAQLANKLPEVDPRDLVLEQGRELGEVHVTYLGLCQLLQVALRLGRQQLDVREVVQSHLYGDISL